MMRTFLLNILVFTCISIALYFSIPIAYFITNSLRFSLASSVLSSDNRADLPNYERLPWAKKHFQEFNALQTDYYSYVGWRRRPFAGETINIENERRIRHTPQTATHNLGRVAYFFGGSTMWGTGSDDAHTIPAQFQAIAGGTVLNFAETSWVAHQSLNLLIRLYTEGHRPDDVIFYDGVNEIGKCRNGNDFWAGEREEQIRQALQALALPKPFQFDYYFQPVMHVAEAVARRIGLAKSGKSESGYDCDKDRRKVDLIAEQLITDWKIAAMIVESYGGRFHAYLQPVSYLSHTRTEHLGSLMRPEFRDQYMALYPLVREKMAQSGVGSDLSAIFDRDEYIYVDDCHVSPNGNAIIAERMASDLRIPRLSRRLLAQGSGFQARRAGRRVTLEGCGSQ